MDYNGYSLEFVFYWKCQNFDFCFLNQISSFSFQNILKMYGIKIPISL